MSKTRIGYIDIAKCIAIVFIIIGHVGLVFPANDMQGGMPATMVKIAFTFHLPLFFIASGYFFPENRKFSLDFMKKDAKTLLLPYLITSILIIGGCTIRDIILGRDYILSFVSWSKAALWGAGSLSDVAIWPDVMRIGGIWFLLAMFWAHILIVSTYRLNEWIRLFVLAMCTVIAAVSGTYIWLPLSIQSGLGCALFLYIGMLARKYNVFEKGGTPIIVLCLCVVAWVYVVIFGGEMSLAMQIYPLGVIDVLGGVAATVVVMYFSRLIDQHIAPVSRFMQWIGRNTLVIFCMHIVEDNVLVWKEIGRYFSDLFGGFSGTWIVVLVMRFIVDAILVAIMYFIPGVKKVYFPQLRKKEVYENTKATSAK